MTIILIGYMGSGKSTIGKKLSEILQMGFIDLDSYIQDNEGMSIPELFNSKGEIYFRKIESHYLKEVLTRENAIISLGGGTPCYGENMTIIKNSIDSRAIYLKTSIPKLVDRLYNERAERPLIAHIDDREELMEFIGKHLFERSFYYSQADTVIVVDGKSVEDIIEDILVELF